MSAVRFSSTNTAVTIATAASVIGAIGFLARGVRANKTAPSNQLPDVVYLHGFRRAKWIPNESPFVLKLETYLRLANIPYSFIGGLDFSTKAKMPWIQLNGVSVADSEFIIDFLEQRSGSLDAHLSDEQKALSTACQRMVSESTFWTLARFRWRDENKPWIKKLFGGYWFPFNHIIRTAFVWHVNRTMYYHGYGRHSDEELAKIGCRDWDAISTFLGDKPFFHGDTPSRIDATLFGFLAQMLHAGYSDPISEHAKKLPNLVRSCDHMKRTTFPDWEQLLTVGDKGQVHCEDSRSASSAGARVSADVTQVL